MQGTRKHYGKPAHLARLACFQTADPPVVPLPLHLLYSTIALQYYSRGGRHLKRSCSMSSSTMVCAVGYYMYCICMWCQYDALCSSVSVVCCAGLAIPFQFAPPSRHKGLKAKGGASCEPCRAWMVEKPGCHRPNPKAVQLWHTNRTILRAPQRDYDPELPLCRCALPLPLQLRRHPPPHVATECKGRRRSGHHLRFGIKMGKRWANAGSDIAQINNPGTTN